MHGRRGHREAGDEADRADPEGGGRDRFEGGPFRRLGANDAAALPTLFRFGAAADLHDSKQTIASLGQGGLGLPDRDDYIKDDAKSKEKRDRYVEHIAKMLQLLGESADQAKADAQTVLRIETGLAKAQLDRVALRDPKNRDNPMTVAELKQLAPAFDWDAYLAATGAPRFARLNVTSKKFFQEGNAVVESTPIADWKTYLRWHVVDNAAPYLSAALVEEDFRFNRQFLSGAKEMEPRWKRCVQATDRDLGDALGKIYVDRTFGADGKARMNKMIEALTAALREDIEGLPWMTAGHQAEGAGEARRPSTAARSAIPTSGRTTPRSTVKRGDYFGNSRRARVFEVQRDYARIDKPTDRTHWGMTPPTVNAYYNAANNEIVFPAGILQPPFFDRDDGRCRELRRHRRGDRPRVHPRLRRPGQQVRRRGQPRELVDGRRPRGLQGAHGLHRQGVRRVRVASRTRRTATST